MASVSYGTHVHWTRHVLQGTRNTRPCITGHPVGAEVRVRVPSAVHKVVEQHQAEDRRRRVQRVHGQIQGSKGVGEGGVVGKFLINRDPL